mmetsp:Transcript_133239/g.259395  ORF Transcript_133239/g.259395 Transcript_133239/m.259395 type:complete len:81 (-) Transcript_133239:367-609(-)
MKATRRALPLECLKQWVCNETTLPAGAEWEGVCTAIVRTWDGRDGTCPYCKAEDSRCNMQIRVGRITTPHRRTPAHQRKR